MFFSLIIQIHHTTNTYTTTTSTNTNTTVLLNFVKDQLWHGPQNIIYYHHPKHQIPAKSIFITLHNTKQQPKIQIQQNYPIKVVEKHYLEKKRRRNLF